MSAPIGYSTPTISRRFTRPLYARRDDVRAAANAVFKDSVHDEKQPTTDNEHYIRLSDDPHDILESRRK